MSLNLTLTILIIAFIITVVANLMSRRPTTPGRIWYPPYHGIQFIGILVILMMCAHLITLLTGKPFAGRLGP